MMEQNGIQELELMGAHGLQVDDAKFLAEAMVYTTCLKRLSIRFGFRDEDVRAAFVEILKRNSSLEELELGLCRNSYNNLPGLLSTLQNHPSLRSLGLTRDDCRLQQLKINQTSHFSAFSRSAGSNGIRKQNREKLILDNPFVNEMTSLGGGRRESTLLQPFLDRANHIRSPERLSMDCDMDVIDLCHTMNVNRGIRYGVEEESSACCGISPALFPRILHRASFITYFSGIKKHCSDNMDSPTDKSPSTRASVVFSLLRDNANLFQQSEKTDEDVPSPRSCCQETKVGVNDRTECTRLWCSLHIQCNKVQKGYFVYHRSVPDYCNNSFSPHMIWYFSFGVQRTSNQSLKSFCSFQFPRHNYDRENLMGDRFLECGRIKCARRRIKKNHRGLATRERQEREASNGICVTSWTIEDY